MNVKCYLNNVEIDISEEFPMPLNFTIDDVRKIETKNTNYSKSLVFP